ncbi:2OG-Fe(II) oxygenase [Aliikangiella sp. G2MR2-5]|uniref:2OG-Fe(II) oxygenase n=1 Tax=Aliikangiella sp. G2MR2-5 TaxID=2788943 RepID=UPI001AEE18D0|nr:2OG-Fe(II) oxygenase [Aliikangiella sp. G2MR2-5]
MGICYPPSLFSQIAGDICSKGYSVVENAFDQFSLQQLKSFVLEQEADKFREAGIGRNEQHLVNQSIRRDKILWIEGNSLQGKMWLDWADQLKSQINQNLFLGLNYFETHVAHYALNDFYRLHTDSFRGANNRILTVILYLNENWKSEDGGELVIYPSKHEKLKIAPRSGTLVTFLSEDFPHEVLPSKADRYSITGWFRRSNPQIQPHCV